MSRDLSVYLLVASAVLLASPLAVMTSIHSPQDATWSCPMCHRFASLGPMIVTLVLVGAVALAVSMALVSAFAARGSSIGIRVIGLLEEEKRVVNLLSSRGPMTQREIAMELGVSRVRAHRLVRQLERRGLVETEPRGRTKLVRLKASAS
ncbi:MAG: MarR family transcriptional regulator [Thaumarchaeota archaeon]|nr:MarR family transcriptional regulator [Candidatus Calditenuaceae archaeon]MCX8203481.1 MarR family transcriptional regulator [Nitrososphaeria archaeon]MDW8043151.1 MarR family transcriptional regulator [Nitrososphaerota archaeon]